MKNSSKILLAALGIAVGSVSTTGPLLAQTELGDERSTYMRYDGQGRLVGEIGPDPDGSGGTLKRPATRTVYDPNGLVLRVESGTLDDWQANDVAPSSWPGFTILQTVRNCYDTLGRLVKTETVGSDGQVVSVVQMNYDRVGREACTAVRMNSNVFGTLPDNACDHGTVGTQGMDRIARNFYDAAGQLTQIRKAIGTPIEIAEVTYTYTDNGQIEYLTDANGNRAKLEYDGWDRQVAWKFPSKTVAGQVSTDDEERYEYDANGNRTRLTKRDGTVINYEYDALNRLTKKVIPARAGLDANQTRDVVYTYDLRDLAIATTFLNSSGAGQKVTYNGFSEATKITDNTAGSTRVLDYAYDANGNRIAIWYPDFERFTYDYDLADRLTRIQHNGATTLMAQSFNDRGLITRVDRNSASHHHQEFGYDAIGRANAYSLTRNSASPYSIDWTFQRNAASQITQKDANNDAFQWDGSITITRDYVVNGLNQYTRIDKDTAPTELFCYDKNGNLTADADDVFKYDIENRLVEKRDRVSFTTCPDPLTNAGYGGALQARLDYDPLGRLYRISDGGTNTTEFLHDGNALIVEYAPGGAIADRYIHGTNMEADDPLVWYVGASVASTYRRNLYADERGSIAFISDIAGNKVALNTFDEYGINGSENAGRFQYTGQAWLEEAELYYYKARIYSPKLGRFLQVDPIGYEDQFNLYAYAGNDPINLIDPTGLDSVIGTGTIYIRPLHQDIPDVEIPRIDELRSAEGFSSIPANAHDYRIPNNGSRISDPDATSNALAARPTPGDAKRATQWGVKNDVGAIPGLSWLDGGDNYVMSFLVPSPDPKKYTDITVNYTIKGEHVLNEGFVMRYGIIRNGKVVDIMTYGEGNSPFQDMAMKWFWGRKGERLWKGVNRRSGF